jgi:hypothetical protein
MPNQTLEQVQVTHFKPAGGFTTVHDVRGNDPTVQPGSGGANTDPYLEPLTVAEYRPPPLTCGDRCDEEEKLARVHCDAIRKRVQQWMKDSGCPSSIKGFKKKPKCGYRKKAAASTPAAPTASTRRGATQRRRR